MCYTKEGSQNTLLFRDVCDQVQNIERMKKVVPCQITPRIIIISLSWLKKTECLYL